MNARPGGAALINPPRFTPKRLKQVDVLAVDCKTCLRQPRERCVNANGQETSSHPTRRRMATRRYNEMRGI